MRVYKYFLKLMAPFKYSFIKVKIWIQSIASAIRVAIKKYFWKALGGITALLNTNYLRLSVLKLNLLSSVDSYQFGNYDLPMSIHDIFKLNLSVLFLHFYLKYFLYRREWESYKWLENFIIVGSYVLIFIIVLLLSCVGLIIVPSTNFEKLIFVILIVLSYYSYYMACTTDWFDKYIYSASNTYTSTVNHVIWKGRKYLIVSDLATRWRPKKAKGTAQKDKKIVPLLSSAPRDPRLNRYPLVNKRLTGIHHRFTALKNRSPDVEDGYILPSRTVRPDTYNCDRLDTFAFGNPVLTKYPITLRPYKLIPI